MKLTSLIAKTGTQRKMKFCKIDPDKLNGELGIRKRISY
jgi:hypothetical protein